MESEIRAADESLAETDERLQLNDRDSNVRWNSPLTFRRSTCAATRQPSAVAIRLLH